LSLAAILDGMSRTEAARIGGMKGHLTVEGDEARLTAGS
jgi:hypothetical protein